MSSKIDTLDLTTDVEPDPWDWPKFPFRLRLFIYHGQTYNKTHAALYAMQTYDVMRAYQRISDTVKTVQPSMLFANSMNVVIHRHWWHRFLRRVAGV